MIGEVISAALQNRLRAVEPTVNHDISNQELTLFFTGLVGKMMQKFVI